MAILWQRNGEILREFALNQNAEVSQVVDYLAAISTSSGTMIHNAVDPSLRSLGEFLADVGDIRPPAGILDGIDLELSNDRSRLLVLFQASTSRRTLQEKTLTPRGLKIAELYNRNRREQVLFSGFSLQQHFD